jgi:hypothetical protein
MEIAEKFSKGELSVNDESIKKAQEFLAELASTEDGRNEIAETIAMYIDENFNKFDIAPYLCNYRNFALGDKPEFRLKKKGIKAYWIAPNSSTPKSRNYMETLSMEFDSLSVRPEAMIDELKAGRIQGFAELVADAKQAMVDAISSKVFTLLDQVYNETGAGKDNFKQDSTNLAQASLNTALDQIFYKTGVRPVIIGDMLLTNQIRDFSGYSEDIKTQITKTGVLSSYRGSVILPLPECKDPVSGKLLVPKNKLYIVSSKVGYAGTYGEAKAGQETSIEDWSWNARIDKEWGMTVTEPKGLYMIEVV